ncbi:MAG TPA: S-methyl-5'-thioadenosine phosphorylase [Chthoniobacterales bacterium]|jgi:5'-methylthioadenosine phosphorylase|nr:S-methyl-5'-thioadenosine phosphorylase [Chthoniobacterales bacterium]
MSEGTPAIGIIGGSGLYQIEGLERPEEIVVETPYGSPSDSLVSGYLNDRRVYFLPRHARGHRLLPTELNHRANIFALRSLNVRWILSLGAVGSLQEKYRPRDIVLPSQFFDRTSRRGEWTFFGNGIVAHVGFADPVSAHLRTIIAEEASILGYTVLNGGTYVNMDGPAFSTRAESEFHRKMGFDIIGMTNLPEAKLAREAEISLASINFVTDYDCWKIEDEPVSAQTIIGHLVANADAARKILPKVIERIPREANWPEHRVLDFALVTDRKLWPEATVKKLEIILERFL